jgi:hypothetical protein
MRAVILALSVAFLAGGSLAYADGASSKTDALLLLRILAYDHNLPSRIDAKKVTIFVVHRTGGDSEDAATTMANVVRDIAKSTKIAGNSIIVQKLAYNDKTFDTDLGRTRVAAIWLAPGLADAVSTITASTMRRRLLSFSSTVDYVPAGVAIGLGSERGKPVISVNLPASRREGADLDAALLKAAKIVKK